MLNKEHGILDCLDKDWRFHNLDYVTIFGNKYENISKGRLLPTIVKEMLDNDKLSREHLLNDMKLRRIATEAGGYAGAFYIHKHKLYVSTNHKFSDMIKLIERLLEFTNTEHNEIKLAFRE